MLPSGTPPDKGAVARRRAGAPVDVRLDREPPAPESWNSARLKARGIVCAPSAVTGYDLLPGDLFHLRRVMPGFMEAAFPLDLGAEDGASLQAAFGGSEEPAGWLPAPEPNPYPAAKRGRTIEAPPGAAQPGRDDARAPGKT